MSSSANEIVVAQMAQVWLAPVGTPAPLGPLIQIEEPWRAVGFFTPDSLSWSTDPSFEEVRSHQANYPTRRFQTEDAASLSVDLQQWNGANFQAVYGGGKVIEVAAQAAQTGPPAVPAIPKHYRFEPPGVGGRGEVAAIIEIIDGIKAYRRIVPRCSQMEGVEQTFEKSSESTLPLRLSILGSDVGLPWYDLTNDEAFADVAVPA